MSEQNQSAIVPSVALENYEQEREEAYQKFVESMVPHCHCRQSNRPCDGVLAGGPCDDLQDEPENEEEKDYDDEEQY